MQLKVYLSQSNIQLALTAISIIIATIVKHVIPDRINNFKWKTETTAPVRDRLQVLVLILGQFKQIN